MRVKTYEDAYACKYHGYVPGPRKGAGRDTEGSPLAGIALHRCVVRMYMYYFRVRKRYKGIIPRGERPRAKRDVV